MFELLIKTRQREENLSAQLRGRLRLRAALKL